MEKLYEKVDNLIKELDNYGSIKKIKKLNDKIIKDKELMQLLSDYNNSKNDEIKNKIINNKLFQEYKTNETDINLLIFEINKRLKEINNKGKCC